MALEIQADMLTPLQCEQLRSGALDVGVLRPPAVGDDIELRTIDVEPLVLAVSADHRLAAEPVVSLTDLRSESFVAYASRRLGSQRRRVAQLQACRVRAAPRTCRTGHRGAAGAGRRRSRCRGRCRRRSVRCRCRAWSFAIWLDGGSIELALAWRRGGDNPVVDAVVDVLSSAFGLAFAPVAVEELL